MNKKVKKVELVLRKINYLFDSIESNPLQSSNLEMALLKRYAVDLYDTILEFEEAEAVELTKTHEVLEEIEETKEVIEEPTPIVETEIPKTVEKSDDSIATKLGIGAIGAGIVAGGANLLDNPTEDDIKEEVTEDLTSILEEVKKREAEEQAMEEVETVEVPEVEEEASIDTLPILEEKIEEETVVVDEEEMIEEEPIEEVFVEEKVEEEIIEEATTPVLEDDNLDIIGRPTERIMGLEEEEPIQEVIEEPVPIQEFIEEPDEMLDGKQTEVLNDVYANVQSESEMEIEPTSNSAIVHQEEEEQEQEPNELNDLFKQGNKKKFNISFNQRFAFISELFGGDSAVYEHTLEELSKCANVIEAFTYLNLHVKLKYQWKDDSPTTKEFQQIVKDSFLSDI